MKAVFKKGNWRIKHKGHYLGHNGVDFLYWNKEGAEEKIKDFQKTFNNAMDNEKYW